MSWLDDTEATDPADPGPNNDAWAAPRHVRGTSHGLPPEAGNATREWGDAEAAAAEPGHIGHGGELCPPSRTFTIDEAYSVAESAVGLFLEYRDRHGRAEDEARAEALGEIAQGLHAWADADEALHPDRAVGRDWRALRAAEAQARQAGLRATIPRPDGRESSGYQGDVDAWGTGRGIAADGPEAGR